MASRRPSAPIWVGLTGSSPAAQVVTTLGPSPRVEVTLAARARKPVLGRDQPGREHGECQCGERVAHARHHAPGMDPPRCGITTNGQCRACFHAGKGRGAVAHSPDSQKPGPEAGFRVQIAGADTRI